MNPGFCEKMEVTRVPPGRPSRTTSGTRTTGWEPLRQTNDHDGIMIYYWFLHLHKLEVQTTLFVCADRLFVKLVYTIYLRESPSRSTHTNKSSLQHVSYS